MRALWATLAALALAGTMVLRGCDIQPAYAQTPAAISTK